MEIPIYKEKSKFKNKYPNPTWNKHPFFFVVVVVAKQNVLKIGIKICTAGQAQDVLNVKQPNNIQHLGEVVVPVFTVNLYKMVIRSGENKNVTLWTTGAGQKN